MKNQDQRLKREQEAISGIHGSDGELKSGTSKEEPEKTKKQNEAKQPGARAKEKDKKNGETTKWSARLAWLQALWPQPYCE